MQQVDWKAVGEHVASNRRGAVFKRVIANVLKAETDRLRKKEKGQDRGLLDGDEEVMDVFADTAVKL